MLIAVTAEYILFRLTKAGGVLVFSWQFKNWLETNQPPTPNKAIKIIYYTKRVHFWNWQKQINALLCPNYK